MIRKWTDLETNVKLSTLWITASLSYLYCDVISLMDPVLLRQYLAGTVNGMAFTPGFLLGAAILISIPSSRSRLLWFSCPECCSTGRTAGRTSRLLHS
jgi:hypothetical protein